MAKTALNLNNDTAVTNRNRYLDLIELYPNTSSLTPRRTADEQTEVTSLQTMFDDDGNLLTAEEAEQALDATTETVGSLQTFTDNIFNPSSDSIGWAMRATRTFDGQTLINDFGAVGEFLRDSNSDGLLDGLVTNTGFTTPTTVANGNAFNQVFTSVSGGGTTAPRGGAEIPIASTNDQIYVRFRASFNSVANVSLLDLILRSQIGSGTVLSASSSEASVTTDERTYSFILTRNSTTNPDPTTMVNIRVFKNSADSTTAITIIKDSFMAVNLTQMYGSGNEPTQAQMDLVPYFNNAIHFGGRVRSIGKNIIRNNLIINKWFSFGQPINFTGRSISDRFYQVKSNQTYLLSLPSAMINSVQYYDANLNWISDTGSSTIRLRQFTTPTNCKFIRYGLGATGDVNIQIEEGSTETDFVEYDERNMFLPRLRSVCDGTTIVRDTLEGNVIIRRTISDFNNLIKNTDSSDWTTGNVLTNTRRFVIDFNNINLLSSTNNPSANIVTGYVRIGNKIVNFSSVNSAITDIETAILDTVGIFRLRLNQSFADSIDELLAHFENSDVEIVFEAPRTYTEALYNSGNLYAFPDGQIQNEGTIPVVSISAQFPESQASEIKTNADTTDDSIATVNKFAILNSIQEGIGQDSYEVLAFNEIELRNEDQCFVRFGVTNTGASSINGIDILTSTGDNVGAGELNGVLNLEYRVSGDSEAFYLTI